MLAVAGQGETFVRLTDPVAGTTPVLLLHGWAATADLNWWRTYEPLAKDRQVIAPDHQGHGRGLRTEAPFTLERCADLAAGVLDALGIPSAVVVGYSMGGPIALRLWERHPHHVAALVLGATALTFNERWYDRMTWRVVAVLEWLLRATGDRWFVRRIVREVIEQDTSMEPLRGWLFGELERGNARDLHDAGVALSRFDGSGLVAPTDIPRAVIITEQDRLVPPPRQHALAQALRASEHPIPADHDVPMVRPSGLPGCTALGTRGGRRGALQRGRSRNHVNDDAEGGSPRSRRPLVMAAVAVVLVLAGVVVFFVRDRSGSNVSPEPSASTAAPTRTRAPLTGLETDEPIRPALMVKIDNLDAARPQDGLFAADVIFEELVEGGLTRFGAVFSSTDPGLVGPVRSVRETDLHLAPLLGRPALAFSGGAVPVLAGVREAARAGVLVPISPAAGDAVFFRRDDKVAPHDLYARAESLWDSANGAEAPDALFAFGPAGAALPASVFSVRFPTTDVRYRWQPETKTWVRSQNGTDQIDAARPDEPFGVDNVVVLHVTYRPSAANELSPEASLDGGEGWVYRDGGVSGCRWSIAPAPAPRISLRTAQGDVCRLAPGRTVVELAPSAPVSG